MSVKDLDSTIAAARSSDEVRLIPAHDAFPSIPSPLDQSPGQPHRPPRQASHPRPTHSTPSPRQAQVFSYPANPVSPTGPARCLSSGDSDDRTVRACPLHLETPRIGTHQPHISELNERRTEAGIKLYGDSRPALPRSPISRRNVSSRSLARSSRFTSSQSVFGNPANHAFSCSLSGKLMGTKHGY